MEEVVSRPHYTETSIGSRWQLGEGELLFEGVANGRFYILQWMDPHPCTYEQNKLDLVGKQQ